MNRLDINIVNLFSSYHVWEESNRFYFETDYSLKYFVDFTKEDNPKFTAYWFNLVNMSGAASPNDTKIWQTVFCIIEVFFRANPDFCFICAAQRENSRRKEHVFSLFGLERPVNKNAITSKP